MRLLVLLIGRLAAVVLLCLAATVAWATVDARRALDADTVATADRVAERMQNLYWQKLLWRDGMGQDTLVPMPQWQTLATASIVAPGICITFAPAGEPPRRLCSQIEAVGGPAPALFAAAFDALFGAPAPVRRDLTARNRDAGFVSAAAAPEAAMRLAWRQVSVAAGVAAALAAAIAALAAAMIGHALLPARTIIEGLHRLQRSGPECRLPRFRTAEFDLIAGAVNDLAAALARTNAARAALTARLFEVQEQERRALARDLHDEFGQCLTAMAALTASIEAGALPQRPDLADDARAMARIQKQMMEHLRSALVRLRSQDVEEIGLEASLRQLVRDHNMRAASGAVFRLDVIGKLTAVPGQVAIDVYRIAQECLTNAVRHGSPTRVQLSVEHAGAGDGSIAVTVEDDGGGDAAAIAGGHGHGILGIRERIAARGGSLAIAAAGGGLRLSAVIPLLAPGPAPALEGAGA